MTVSILGWHLLNTVIRMFCYWWALSVIVPQTPLYLEGPWHYLALSIILHALSTQTLTYLGKDPRKG